MERVETHTSAAYAGSELALLVAVCRALAVATDVDEALERSLDLICRTTGWQVGHAYLPTATGDLTPSHVWWLEDDTYAPFRAASMARDFHPGEGLPGQAVTHRRAVYLGDLATAQNFPRGATATEVGLKSGIALPVFLNGSVSAVLEFFSTTAAEPSPMLVEVLDTAAVQLGRSWARQRAESELATSESRFRAVAETAHDAIVAADAQGTITFANGASERLFGVAESALVGRPLTDLMPERFRAAHHAGFERFLATGQPRVIGTVVEVAGQRFDGTEFPLELSLGHGSSDAGEFFTGILRDITERKRTEQFLQRTLEREQEASEQLRALDEMKNSFLTAVSHEMRTPLASVLGIGLTLDRKPDLPEEARRELLSQLARNANRLDQLLEDLLDVDRLTRGVVELRRTEEDLGALTRRIMGKSGLSGRAVSVEIHDEPLMALVDVPKVERVLEHLLGNVARHTPPETAVWVHLRRTAEGIVIGVDDAGPGVPAALRTEIFEPFRQGPTLRPHSPGTGLGLSLVARFAALHGGRAWVEDRPGGGAAFRVLIPAQRP